MRLRSSQFVFLLLIACSVQIREEHALRWAEQAISGASVRALTVYEVFNQAGVSRRSAGQPAVPVASLGLPPAALAAKREPWTMRRPASDSASIAAHTGLLRA